MKNFKQKLEKYADLIVNYGVNLQEEQCLYVAGKPEHRELILKINKKAYKNGAKFIKNSLQDKRLKKIRTKKSQEENLDYLPNFIKEKSKEMKRENWAAIYLVGSNHPNVLENVDPKKINKINRRKEKSHKPFNEARAKKKVQWTIAPAATKGWAKEIFPNKKDEEAKNKLWSEIFDITMTNKNDSISAWEKHDKKLNKRREKLNSKDIKKLIFQDKGTNLEIYLPDQAKFEGGRWKTPKGVKFEPNIPTYEIFTAPNHQKTQGTVQITKPCMLNGQLIKGLKLKFENGELIKFSAKKGEETFKEFINSEENADKLGEVALVGSGSPIFKSNILFKEVLLDENSACHIAFGEGYQACIKRGSKMSQKELNKIGFNHKPTVHHDFMISSENTNVEAVLKDRQKIKVIKDGKWKEF
ncbi:MAG: aminopeptidase [Candidatus Magasanikbacteria bacterium]